MAIHTTALIAQGVNAVQAIRGAALSLGTSGACDMQRLHGALDMIQSNFTRAQSALSALNAEMTTAERNAALAVHIKPAPADVDALLSAARTAGLGLVAAANAGPMTAHPSPVVFNTETGRFDPVSATEEQMAGTRAAAAALILALAEMP